MVRVYAKGLLGVVIFAAGVAAIPMAAGLGLIVLGTEPNPRHPPEEIWGAAVGWAILAAVVGAVGVIIGEAVVLVQGRGIAACRGFFLGTVAGMTIAAFLCAGLVVIQKDSFQGQPITSASLGALAGATVGAAGGIAGAVVGAILKRVVTALMP